MGEDRSWMYSERKGSLFNKTWKDGLDSFLDHAFSLPEASVDGKSKCPCTKCDCRHKRKRDEMEIHLCRNGFQLGYERWTNHGEANIPEQVDWESTHSLDRMDEMLLDAISADQEVNPSEEPTQTAKELYKLLEEADKPLHDRTSQSSLSIVARLMTIKTQYNLPEACYNETMNLIREAVGDEAANNLPTNFYRSKKLVHSLGMPYVKIHACPNGCMIYYNKDNEDKESCTTCGESRYEEPAIGNKSRKVPKKVLRYLPITSRLQRLYMSQNTAKHMEYHAQPRNKNVMVHPSDGEAWTEFDKTFPDFAKEVRNVRLGLVTDGFTPFSANAAPYSCWPVFVVPYNLPPEMCTRKSNIILALIIPGREHPGKNFNVYIQPLIDELKDLWDKGAHTHDSYRKENFTMRAIVLWTIHDFPAYGLVACWSTHGKLACPICGSDINTFTLKHGRKPCWFDCHRRFLPDDHAFRKSLKCFRKKTKVFECAPKRLSGEEIYQQLCSLTLDKKEKHKYEGFGKLHNWIDISGLWQLPYWKKLVLRHNIDVMHNEKNVADVMLSMCIDITERTKDNSKARLDMAEICDRPTLELTKAPNGTWKKPRAKYCVSKDDKLVILKWFKQLKFPDRFAANLRKSVKLDKQKFVGLKSHDFHIIIERLLPVALRGFIPEREWKDIAELCFFIDSYVPNKLIQTECVNLRRRS
jgi:hypothetical protein